MTSKRPMMHRRGADGVMRIRADSEKELYRGLGYCHGHDRALQLLLMRILLSGRACATVQDNDEMFAMDRFVRRVDLAGGLDAATAALSAADRALADAYCEGVNDALS